MLTIKLEKIETGYLCECTGHTLKGERCVSHLPTLGETIDHLKARVDDFESAETERQAIASVQNVLSDAQKRYKASQDAGGSLKERIAAALNIPPDMVPPDLP